jgi:hypothetical protein
VPSDFYFEKVIQPGQAGIIRVKIPTASLKGAIENHYEIKTNDPRTKLIKLTVLASVKPLPDYIKHLGDIGIARGEQVGTFNVWPNARPSLSLERGKSVAFSLRIKPVDSTSATLRLAPETPDYVKLRQDAKQKIYWLDIAVGPFAEPGTKAVPIKLESSYGGNITVNLAVNIPAENFIITPRELDIGEVTLSAAKTSGMLRNGRLGVRKLVGSFKIKSLSSTLDFIKLEQQTIIDGNNYLVRLRIDTAAALKPGAYNGVVRIETDEGQLTEVPIKITLVDR